MDMDNPASVISVAHVIQTAVAPVFLLTGIGAILGVLVNRLGRIVDRRRKLAEFTAEMRLLHAEELRMLWRRTRWIHRSITLCTLSALLVCLVIVALFVGAELRIDPGEIVAALFIAAMLGLIGGLFCFLREIALATSRFQASES
ncbi:DUF2721 domain-containing protein [Rhodocyclus tenuis]|uniref:DUF2721 domain-containing protein n=1 Tax=Rhodocyclus tenuis TaxID=1066 RepID=A0A840GAY1_RHOTE|nr:DUF2721 domain-containing protein [Rhodocyclus tenuis]MBB4248050.1 hypothetical protein [Rhodocyclus tenuis]